MHLNLDLNLLVSLIAQEKAAQAPLIFWARLLLVLVCLFLWMTKVPLTATYLGLPGRPREVASNAPRTAPGFASSRCSPPYPPPPFFSPFDFCAAIGRLIVRTSDRAVEKSSSVSTALNHPDRPAPSTTFHLAQFRLFRRVFCPLLVVISPQCAGYFLGAGLGHKSAVEAAACG